MFAPEECASSARLWTWCFWLLRRQREGKAWRAGLSVTGPADFLFLRADPGRADRRHVLARLGLARSPAAPPRMAVAEAGRRGGRWALREATNPTAPSQSSTPSVSYCGEFQLLLLPIPNHSFFVLLSILPFFDLSSSFQPGFNPAGCLAMRQPSISVR